MAWAMKEILRSSQNARINSAVMNSLTKMLLLLHTNPIPTLSFGEQGMAQWWERSPPTSVARVQIPASTHMWVEFVVGSLLCSESALRGFSLGTPVFPSPQKPTFPNSNSTRNQVDEEPLCGCATSKSLFIYLLIYISTLFLIYIRISITAS